MSVRNTKMRQSNAFLEDEESLELLSSCIFRALEGDVAVFRLMVNKVTQVSAVKSVFGVIGPFRSKEITPPTMSIGALVPLSCCGYFVAHALRAP